MLNIFTRPKKDTHPDGAERSTTDGGAGSCAPDAPRIGWNTPPPDGLTSVILKRGERGHAGRKNDDHPRFVLHLPTETWDAVFDLLKKHGERPTQIFRDALDEYLAARGMGRPFADSERADGGE